MMHACVCLPQPRLPCVRVQQGTTSRGRVRTVRLVAFVLHASQRVSDASWLQRAGDLFGWQPNEIAGLAFAVRRVVAWLVCGVVYAHVRWTATGIHGRGSVERLQGGRCYRRRASQVRGLLDQLRRAILQQLTAARNGCHRSLQEKGKLRRQEQARRGDGRVFFVEDDIDVRER